MVCFNIRVHLDGQTVEIVQIGHFGEKSVYYSPHFRVGPRFKHGVWIKLIGAYQGGIKSSQCGTLQYSWPFGWINGQTRENKEFFS